MTSAEYRQAIDSLPHGKRLPGAVYLIDPGDDARVPSLLRITIAELRKRLDIGPAFNLLKFHTASPKVSFLSYPDFEKDPHPALSESIIVDLITGKTRRDDYRGRANPPILHRKETFLPLTTWEIPASAISPRSTSIPANSPSIATEDSIKVSSQNSFTRHSPLSSHVYSPKSSRNRS